jgi:transcriptional regulator GlxA family with amidase domain
MRKKRQSLVCAKLPRTIVFLATPNTQILDVAGPYQIFVRAAELVARRYPAQKPAYEVQLVSCTRARSVQTNCGLVLSVARSFHSHSGHIDTLLVAGGSAVDVAARDAVLLDWLRKTSKGVRRIGSICTGAFLLAAAEIGRAHV